MPTRVEGSRLGFSLRGEDKGLGLRACTHLLSCTSAGAKTYELLCQPGSNTVSGLGLHKGYIGDIYKYYIQGLG